MDRNPGPRILTPEEVNQKWKETVAGTDRIIHYYKNRLLKMGVPDCAWLQDTLARHRAGILQQASTELEVLSGHMPERAGQAASYQTPEDMKRFFSDLKAAFCKYCLDGTNPNYDTGPEWHDNCQHCVPTYEARRRGLKMTAKLAKALEHLAYHPFDAWVNPTVLQGEGTGKETIEEYMSRWGDGARVQVVVLWDRPQGDGHTFMAERIDGKTVYYDPQNGNEDVSYYFDIVKPNMTSFCRIDTLDFSGFQSDCFEEEKA